MKAIQTAWNCHSSRVSGKRLLRRRHADSPVTTRNDEMMTERLIWGHFMFLVTRAGQLDLNKKILNSLTWVTPLKPKGEHYLWGNDFPKQMFELLTEFAEFVAASSTCFGHASPHSRNDTRMLQCLYSFLCNTSCDNYLNRPTISYHSTYARTYIIYILYSMSSLMSSTWLIITSV